MFNNQLISNYFNYMKWMAILGIFMFHFVDSLERYSQFQLNNIIQKLVHVGSQGIHIFFIFSAFFLYAKYHDKPDNFKVLYRLKKLYPQYLVAVFFVIILLINTRTTISLEAIVVNILPIIRNFSFEYIRSINGNWWFLHTLIEFYLIFKGLIYIKSRWGLHWLMVISLITYITYILFYTFYLKINSQTLNPYSTFVLNYIYDFIFGFYLYIYAPILLNTKRNPFIYIIVGILFESFGLVLTKYFGVFGINSNDIFFAVGWFYFLYGFILLIFNHPNIIFNKLLSSSGIIYMIYLIHHPIIISTIKYFKIDSVLDILLLLLFTFSATIYISKFLWSTTQVVIKYYAK